MCIKRDKNIFWFFFNFFCMLTSAYFSKCYLAVFLVILLGYFEIFHHLLCYPFFAFLCHGLFSSTIVNFNTFLDLSFLKVLFLLGRSLLLPLRLRNIWVWFCLTYWHKYWLFTFRFSCLSADLYFQFLKLLSVWFFTFFLQFAFFCYFY